MACSQIYLLLVQCQLFNINITIYLFIVNAAYSQIMYFIDLFSPLS